MEVKDQIRRRVSITDVASLYVDLKPAGKYMKALCPFHTEKTPSFYITPEKDTFACYGCNKFGDIFTMVQDMEQLTFPEAMNFLIEKFHVPVEKSKSGKTTPTAEYSRLNELALKFFQESLFDSQEGKKALQYLKKRGISRQTMETFKIGYAPNLWDGLHKRLLHLNCNITKATELGLLIKNPQKNSTYDRFRGRIITPIYSESGGLIAFGGRTIIDDNAKYLNSPETPIYRKSNHVYGFNWAKQAIREKKSVILVEGYFDMISLYQHGVQNAVASLGTALTDQQIYLLKRFAEKVFIYYDSDKAGIAAAVRGIEKMFEQNINPRIVVSADAKDPDLLIREQGQQAFNQVLNSAVGAFKFLVDNTLKQFDINNPQQKSKAIDEVMKFVEKFNDPIVLNEYIDIIADVFKVDKSVLKAPQKTASRQKNNGNMGGLDITLAEQIFIKCVLVQPAFLDAVKEVLTVKMLGVLASGNIIRQLLHNYDSRSRSFMDFGRISQGLSDAERSRFSQLFDTRETEGTDWDELEGKIITAVKEFNRLAKQEQQSIINRDIKRAAREDNQAEYLRLLAEKSKHKKQKFKKHQGGTVEIL